MGRGAWRVSVTLRPRPTLLRRGVAGMCLLFRYWCQQKHVLQKLVGRVQWCMGAALLSDLSCSCTCDCAGCRRFRRATIANSAELPDRSIGLLPWGCWCSLLECRAQGLARMQGRTVRSRVGYPGRRNPQGPGLPVGASPPGDQPAEHQPASLQRSCEWHANDAGVSSAI